MFPWVVLAGIGLASALLVVLVGMGTQKKLKRYHQEIAEWAQERGWTFREGHRDPVWKTRLPQAGDLWVKLQVDGVLPPHVFTIVYAHKVNFAYSAVAVAVEVDITVVVVYLPTAHPYAEIKPRSMFRRPSTSDAIGHAKFDKKFRVLTKASRGPASLVTKTLAEAHLNGDVPLWKLQDKELMCHSYGKPEVKNLDVTLNRALRVAELITAPYEPGV